MKLIKDRIQLSPTDLVNYLGCKHLTELDRKVAIGDIEKPDWNNPAVAILHKKGSDHESAYVKHLLDSDLSVVDLSEKHSHLETVNAMKNGVDIIYQAPLQSGQWGGFADILRKVDGKSRFGSYSYEVADTKLARDTKSATVLQLCFYSEIVAIIQESTPEFMHVVKPGSTSESSFERETFRITDFRAYYSLIKDQFEQVITHAPAATYPVPVARCEICRWWKTCNEKWHDDDHLSLIAGIHSSHVDELEKRQECKTLHQFAENEYPLKNDPRKGSTITYEKLHGQAQIQLKGRINKRPEYQLLTIESERGLNRLPKPDKGDVYFDIEGDHFYEDGGMEYLLGWVSRGDHGRMVYDRLWSLDRDQEKHSFEQFIDSLMDRWKTYPDFYIYHYAPYEPSAIKRLATRHGTREQEVDQLLRAERFVDLHTVIKESLQASVEKYSLKDMEAFTSFDRTANLFEAAAARRKIQLALDLKIPSNIHQDDIHLVEVYNKDDCLATEALHQWLESVYNQQTQHGITFSRPERKSGDPSDDVDDQESAARKLYEGLISELPDDPLDWSDEDRARWLLAHQVDYHRREAKSAWWEYFRLYEIDRESAFEERHAIAGLTFEKELPKEGRERNPTHRYRFPEQEVSVAEGDNLAEVLGDKVGSVKSISLADGRIDIKKNSNSIGLHPDTVYLNDVMNDKVLPASLHEFANSILGWEFDERSPYQACRHLLLRKSPKRTPADPIRLPSETTTDGAIRTAINLDRSTFPIQGPPGSGKTFIGAHMIIELSKRGKRVGVTAVSHKVIRNLLDKSIEISTRLTYPLRAVHKPKESSAYLPNGLTEAATNAKALAALDEGKVVGGTAYLWARDEAEETLDYLFVDEAGQMSLANVLAAGRSAKNIILLGDPQQLEQPQRGSHPEGADISALNHVLQDHKTMPEDMGLFLDTSWRLHPEICRFTSELFYENKLQSKEGLEVQRIRGDSAFSGSGLFFSPVDHHGNQNRSDEEVQRIKEIVSELLTRELTWIDRGGYQHDLDLEDILIVAPYNAQVGAIRHALPDMRIGTVDKFQGQEAPVVIYSMTSSSAEDAPRGMSFLYDPHRFNVATSRALCSCILVASPLLMEPDCHSIDQMKWANGLCRYIELAKPISC